MNNNKLANNYFILKQQLKGIDKRQSYYDLLIKPSIKSKYKIVLKEMQKRNMTKKQAKELAKKNYKKQITYQKI